MNLPNEIILMILSFIDEINYGNIRLVCSLWKEIFERIWDNRKINFKLKKEIQIKKAHAYIFADNNFCYVMYYDLLQIYKINNMKKCYTIHKKDIYQIFIYNNIFYYIKKDILYSKNNLFSGDKKIIISHKNIDSFVIFNNIILVLIKKELYKYTDNKLIFISNANIIRSNCNYLYIYNEGIIYKLNDKFEIIGKSNVIYYCIKDFCVDNNDNIFVLSYHTCNEIRFHDKDFNIIKEIYLPVNNTIFRMYINNDRKLLLYTKKDHKIINNSTHDYYLTLFTY